LTLMAVASAILIVVVGSIAASVGRLGLLLPESRCSWFAGALFLLLAKK